MNFSDLTNDDWNRIRAAADFDTSSPTGNIVDLDNGGEAVVRLAENQETFELDLDGDIMPECEWPPLAMTAEPRGNTPGAYYPLEGYGPIVHLHEVGDPEGVYVFTGDTNTLRRANDNGGLVPEELHQALRHIEREPDLTTVAFSVDIGGGVAHYELRRVRTPRVGDTIFTLLGDEDCDENDQVRKAPPGTQGVVTLVDEDHYHVVFTTGTWVVLEQAEVLDPKQYRWQRSSEAARQETLQAAALGDHAAGEGDDPDD